MPDASVSVGPRPVTGGWNNGPGTGLGSASRDSRVPTERMGAMSTDLGMPQTPPAPLAARRQSRQIMVGPVPVGGGAPVSVQSMTTTLTGTRRR